MANSNIDIANLALTYLGERPISSLDGNDKTQTYCATNIAQARDEILSFHPWSFAVARKSMNVIADADNLTDYTYVYALPSDYLRVLGVYAGTATGSLVTAETDWTELKYSASYLIEEGQVYTDAASAWVHYIKKITDPNNFPPHVVDAIAANLAKKIAFALTQNAGLFAGMNQVYQANISRAMMLDGQQQVNTPSPPTTWEDI